MQPEPVQSWAILADFMSDQTFVKTEWIRRLFRWAYGGFFLFWGGVGMVGTLFGIGEPPAPPNPESAALMDAINQSFLGTLALLTFVAGGTALLFQRTTPLGLMILTPSVAFIFFYHLTLTGSVIWGSIWLAGLLLMAWWYRDAWRDLVHFAHNDEVRREGR